MKCNALHLLPALMLAAVASAAPEIPSELPVPMVHEVTLGNGMRFLLVRRPEAPVFHGVLTFRVGGVDDPKNASGLAHLFEHMAFKGTRAIGTRDWAREKPLLDRIEKVGDEATRLEALGTDPARHKRLRDELASLHAELKTLLNPSEFMQTYSEAGGNGINATTSHDRTNYFVSLPSNRLELWMLMESERFRDPVLREFYVERDVVPEERRMRVDTNPGGLMWEALLAAAYTVHPYGTSVIGCMSDIQRLSMEEARTFYQTNYSPHNAFGVLVGDLDLAKTRELLERYFGRIPRRGDPVPIDAVEPPQRGERRVEVRFDAAPQLMMAFHKPRLPHPDDLLADLAGMILGDGQTSRLNRRLVLKDRIARNVGAGNGAPGDRYDNLFMITAQPLKGHTTAECEAAIDEEIARIAKEGISQEELDRARAQLEVSTLGAMDSNEGLARLIAQAELSCRDWREPWKYLQRVQTVQPADVQAFVAKYLVRDNRTVAVLVPTRTEGAAKP